VADQNEQVADITIDVTGAKDADGNAQQDYAPQSEFSIDTLNPAVTSVDASDALITDANVGNPFTLTVVFDEAMDNTATPTLTLFDPPVDSTLTFSSGAWSADNTTYTATYSVADGNVNSADVKVDVTGAKDAAGNTQQGYTPVAEFSIDTLNLAVTSVTATPTTLGDADVGAAKLTVAVVFSKSMDITTPPALTFSPDETGAPTPTLSNPSAGVWSTTTSTNDTFTRTYDVADQNEQVADITIDVTGAKDAGGNAQQDYAPESEFSIDTLNPTVMSIVRADPDFTNASTVNFTVTFSEDVNGVDASGSDFALTTTVTGASIASASGSGRTYTVTVNTGTSDGTINLDLAASPAIQNLAGNALTATNVSGPDETYTTNLAVGNIVTVLQQGNDLMLVGTGSNNHVAVHGTGVTGEFVITGKGGTLLRLGASQQTFSSLPLNGITDDIFSMLGDGADIFELGSETSRTKVGSNVEIENIDDDTNILTKVEIGNELRITRRADDVASSELHILDSIIRQFVDIDNGDGDTTTDIQDSEIEGNLDIVNGDGDDSTIIAGTTIGAEQFVRPGDANSTADPVVLISNGAGGSLTSFTRKNDPDSTGSLPTGTLGRPTIFGGIQIVNGNPIPPGLEVPLPVPSGALPSQLRAATDIVVFNNATVIGELDVQNFDGHTETIIVDSQIGTDAIRSDAAGGYGEAATILNGDGFDITLVKASTLPYGFGLVNDLNSVTTGGTNGRWGSQTDIVDSKIGGRESNKLAFLAGKPGVALYLSGDDADDDLIVTDTTSTGTEIDGELMTRLYNGNDQVRIVGVPGTVKIDSLNISGSRGDDWVYLENMEVRSIIMVFLDEGVDRLEIRDGVTLPNQVSGTIELDGGDGADVYHIDAGIPFTNCEIPVP
jgi:hypothetical protein